MVLLLLLLLSFIGYQHPGDNKRQGANNHWISQANVAEGGYIVIRAFGHLSWLSAPLWDTRSSRFVLPQRNVYNQQATIHSSHHCLRILLYIYPQLEIVYLSNYFSV